MGYGQAVMKILVTGGGGFLGGAISRQLLDLGHRVVMDSHEELSWDSPSRVSQVP